MLKYNDLGSAISVDLKNGYVVTAIAKALTGQFDENIIYHTTYYLNRHDIDMWDKIDVEQIAATRNTFKTAIAQRITDKANSGYYQKYLTRHERELFCSELGNDLIERVELKVERESKSSDR